MVSGPGLVLYVLVVTFMSVDWVMSLDPHWFSTIFGVLTLGGQGLATLAFTGMRARPYRWFYAMAAHGVILPDISTLWTAWWSLTSTGRAIAAAV